MKKQQAFLLLEAMVALVLFIGGIVVCMQLMMILSKKHAYVHQHVAMMRSLARIRFEGEKNNVINGDTISVSHKIAMHKNAIPIHFCMGKLYTITFEKSMQHSIKIPIVFYD